MTLFRPTALALTAAMALAGLVVPGAPANAARPPSIDWQPHTAADGPRLLHADPTPAGVRLGTVVPTSRLVEEAAVETNPARFERRQQPLALGPASAVDVLVTPGGRPGLRGLVEHAMPSCTGTGSDGNRVQVLYVVEAGQPDRYDELLPTLQSFVADADDTFALSSRESPRRVRWVTDPSCTPVVDHVVVPSGTLAKPDLVRLKSALGRLGYTSPTRKYLVLADAAQMCGLADVYVDDRAAATNRNNGGVPMYARVDTPCWAVPRGGHSTPAHELMHMLGAVQPSAPNATPTGHCTDERDAMCYADGDGQPMRRVCTQPDDEQLFDCHRDDYFDPVPQPASTYLRTHWNTANSSFLDRMSLARGEVGLPAIGSITGATRLRPGLGTTLTAAADRPVRTVWTSSKASCLGSWTSGARVRVQCPTDATGSVTLMATLTAEDGTVARVSRRIVLSAGTASLTVATQSPAEVEVGQAAPLQAQVTYRGGPVMAALSLQQYAGRTRGWVTIDTVTTGADGLAEFSLRRDTVGPRTYRVLVRTAKGSGWETSLSSSVPMLVVPAAVVPAAVAPASVTP
jgi:hypothetical protein